MKRKAFKLLFLSTLLLSINACKNNCPEDSVINIPLYTEHRIFTNYDLGDSICFVSENLDTAKLFFVKMDTFTDRSFSNTDIDCGTSTIYNTAQLRSFWKGSNELLNEIRIVTFNSTNQIEFIGRSWFEFGMTGAYYPFPHLAAKYYDSLLMGSNYFSGIKFEAPQVVLLFNSREGVLKINYRGKLWKRAY